MIIKCSALAVTASVIGLILKKTNAEFSFALSAAVIAVILLAVLKLSGITSELLREIRKLTADTDVQLMVMLKCVGIAGITKMSAELCRDASQNAAAAAVEFAGTVCAAAVSFPMITGMLKLIGEMV